MKRHWLLLLIAANLLVGVALAFVYPQQMVSPGPLVAAHAKLENDCFACHLPWRGTTAERCTKCHAPADIGQRSTLGLPVAGAGAKAAFHQELTEQNCMACHSDHAGPRLTRHSRKPFSHALLRTATRERCESCHAAPKNELHRSLAVACGSCHKTAGWKPAGFDHALLPPAERARCESCHKAPTDTLHRQIKGSCTSCHQPQGWKPATFEHGKLFLLDGDHNATCITCHTGDDYSRYTCYGCHEHSADRIRAKHQEEGIQDFENCVKCHRSADEREGGQGREGRDNGKRRKRD